MRFLNTPKRLGPYALTVTLLTAGVGVSVASIHHRLSPLAREGVARILSLSAQYGLALRKVTVSGATQTNSSELLAAIQLSLGQPLLSFDPTKARARIEALPWVKTAHIERRFPDSIHIEVVEQVPAAIWKNGENFMLVDDRGSPIAPFSRDFANLPVVSGDDAPNALPQLILDLAAEPSFAKRVRAARRMGRRRWDLFIQGPKNDGIMVRLPARNVSEAISRLAALDRTQDLLNRDFSMIDMRLDDRLVVRMNERALNGTTTAAVATGFLPERYQR